MSGALLTVRAAVVIAVVVVVVVELLLEMVLMGCWCKWCYW